MKADSSICEIPRYRDEYGTVSTIPPGAGVSSSAAIEVATMMNLRDHFGLMKPFAGRALRIAEQSAMNPMRLAEMCQAVENRIVGAPCGIMDQVSSCLGEMDTLLRMSCQPHEIGPPLAVPPGMRFVGINSQVRHAVWRQRVWANAMRGVHGPSNPA